MQWDKVKTILLAILLMVDGFLAWNLSQNVLASFRQSHETLTNVRTLVGAEGVRLDADFSLPAGRSLPALESERSIRAEEETAAALLGESPAREDGEDGSALFTNTEGERILFRRDGTLEARLRCTGSPNSRTERRQAAALALTGFPTHGGVFEVQEDGTVLLTAEVAGAPLFNRALRVRFEEGWAVAEGRWTLTLPYTTTGSSLYYDGADALLTYAYDAPDGTVIREMRLGYRLGEENAGRVPLVAVWRIVTDQGVVYLDTSKMTIIPEEIS